MYHEFYAFGLLMVEVGLWSPIATLFTNTINRKGTRAIHDVVVRKAKGMLRHPMGVGYESAAVSCITGDFGITEDDVRSSRLVQQFERSVLRKIESQMILLCRSDPA